jgi:hypothetical protein
MLNLIYCSQPSTNLVYFKDLTYKHLFTYDGSSYSHVLFVKNRKTQKIPNQVEMEQLALHYAHLHSKIEPSKKKIDYIKFISEEFAQKDEIDEFGIANVHLEYENGEIKVKQFYKFDK